MMILRKLVLGLMLAALLLSGGVAQAKSEGGSRKPPTKVTEKLSPKVYKQIEAAQVAMEAADFAGAETIITALQGSSSKLNDYEKSQIFNFLAAIHYEQGKTEQTIADYIGILKLDNPPEQIRNNALFRLAQLYFVEEDYTKSIRVLDEWMSKVESVRPEAYMLKAQAYYQLDDYENAKAPIIEALKEARRRKQALNESWLALLRAVYYELGDYRNAVKVLSQLVQRWPKPSYYKQLSGMLGLMESQKGQLLVMHAVSVNGMLENQSELLNMARLYMAEDAPYPAIELIQQGMASGQIEETAQNLQLLAQAMSLAKESDAQIPVLVKAAKLSGSSKQYLYLGQAQLALYRWGDASQSLEKALDIGELDRTGSVYMQVGTAYYNLKKYSRARQAFKEAGAYPDNAQQAQQWVDFVGQEIKRTQALAGL
jgi:tetratricopeptide (TPR) repeat protein